MKLNQLRNELTTVSAWKSLLESETEQVDRAGVKAAVIIVRLSDQIDLSSSASTAGNPILKRVIDSWLRPTDRAAHTGTADVSILVTPTAELAETLFRVNQLDSQLSEAGLEATCSFAQRRPEETLVSSWGRAQAELDRAIFRGTLGGCLAV